MKIKIIGCGFAGLSSALLLSTLSETTIEIYEKFEMIKPVGAGIILQPSVLDILNQLNIIDKVVKVIEPINAIIGKNKKGKEIFSSYYKNEIGMGITRSSFFNILYEEIKTKNNIKIHLNYEVNEKEIENFSHDCDLLIICSGSKSILNSLFEKKVNRNYEYGCLWGMIENNEYTPNILSQFVDGSKQMFGILPSGNINEKRMLSVFWSIPMNNNTNIINEKNKIKEYKHFLSNEAYNSIMDMEYTVAQYKDIVMKKYNKNNILLIGDIAHAMSPQLGQGANMALIDSYLLYQLINNRKQLPIETILEQYSIMRKKHIHFYSQASRFLTPLFQSDSTMNGIQRDIIFSLLGNTRYMQWMNSTILRGTRQSWIYNNKIQYNQNDFFK